MSMNFSRVLGAIISLNSDLLSLPSVVASGRKHQPVNQDLEALFKAEIYEQNKTEQYTQTNCCGCEQCFYGAPRLESDLPFSGRQNGLRINDWFDPEEAKKSQGGLLAAAGESGSSDEARRTLEAVLVSIPPKTHTNDTDSEGSVVTFLDHHGSATTSMNAGDDKDDFLFSDGSSVAVIDDEKSDFSRQVAEHHHQTQTELHQFSVKDDLTGCITQGACKPPTLFDSGVFKCNTKDLIPKPLTKSQLTPDVRFAKATFCEKEAPTICQNPYSKPLTTSTGGIAVAAAARMALPLIAPEYHMAAQTGAFLMGAFTADKLGRNTSDVRIYKVDMGSSWMSGLVGKNEFAVSTVSVPSGLQFYVKNNAFTPIKTLSIEEQVKLQAGDGDGKDEVEDVTPKEKRSKKKGSRNAKSGNQMVDEVGAEAGSGLQLQKFAKKSDLISGLFTAGMHSLGLTKSGNEDGSTNDGDSKKTVPSVSDENDDSIEQVDLVERPLNDQAQPTVGITLNSGSMSTFKSIPYLAAGRLDFDHTRISSNSLVVAKIKVPVVDARSVVGESQFSGFDYYRRMSEHVRTRICLKLAKEALKRTKKSSVESLASDDILNEIEMANISMKLREATKAERDRERKRFRQEQEKAKEDAEASKDDCEDCGGCDDCEDEAAADPNQPAPPPDPKKDPTYDAGAIYTIEMEFSGKFSARKVARASSKSSESDDDGQSELDFQKTILTFPVRMDDVDGRYYRLKKKGEALRILEEPTFSWDKEVVVGLHWTDYLVRWYIGEDEKNLKMVQAAKAVDTSLGAISAANKFYQRMKNRFRGTDSEDNDDTDKLASRHATFSRQSFGFLGGDRYLTFDTQVVAPKKDRNMTTFLGSLARYIVYLSSNPPKGHTFNEAVILSKKKTQIGYQDDDLFDRPLASSRITRSSQNAKKARKTTLLENDGTNKDAKKSKKIHSDAVAADDDIRDNFKPLYNQGLEKSRIRATLLNLSIFKPALGGSELLSNWVGRNDDRECCCDTMCNFCCCTFPSLCGHFCCVIPTQKIICYDQTVEECCCGCGGCTQECCARECCCCDEDEICGPEKPPPPPDVSQAGFPAIVVGAATGKTYEHHHQGLCLASDIQVWDSGKLYLDVLLDYTGRNAYEFRNGISLNREKANNLWLGHSKGMQFSKSCMICIVDMMECALVKCKFQCINKDAPDCRKCVRNTCQRHKDKYKDPYTHSYVDGGVGSNQRLTFEMCTGFITREEIESIDGQQRLA